MNLYQLVPTSCYDDDDGVNSEFWNCGTPDSAEDGRTSRGGFYDDLLNDNVSEEMGWYNVVGHDVCTATVTPVPHLLPLDAAHLKFFDDDSSAENETFFGRTLDTISEEDEDDAMERVAATDAEAELQGNRMRMHLGGDGDGVDYRSVNSGMLCLSPTLVVGHPFFDFSPSSTHEVVSSSRGDHLYRPNSINLDSPTMPDVLSDSDETAFYVDDRRFCERLASFGDESFDNGESKQASRIPDHRRPASHYSDCSASENAVEDRHLPTRRVDNTAADAGENISHSDSLNDQTSLPITTCTAVMTLCQPREQPWSTTYAAELHLPDATSQPTAADWSSFCQSAAAKDHQSPSPCAESVEESSDVEHDVTFVESECKVDENTTQENCTSEEIKTEVDTRRPVDVFDESEKSRDSPLDSTLSKLSNRIDEVDNEVNGNYSSCDNNTETNEDIVKVNSCSHRLFSIDRIVADTSKYEIFDSSASIYDRIEKYYGIPNRRRQISCTKELSQLGLRVPSHHVAKQLSNDRLCLELSAAAGKRCDNFDASVDVDSDTVILPTDSAKSRPHPMTNACSCQHFQCSDTDVHTEADVGTSNERNWFAESIENVPEKVVIEQSDENAAAILATLKSEKNASLKGDVIVKSESLTCGTTNDNSVSMLARTVPADVDLSAVGNCSSLPRSLDKKTQLAAIDTSVTTEDAEMRSTNVSDLESVLTEPSRDKRRRDDDDDDDDTAQVTTTNARVSVVSSNTKLGRPAESDIGVKSRRPWSSSAQSLSFIMVDIDIDERRPFTSSTVCDEHRQRLEAMKKQLMNAKPVAPASSSIDSVWNSRIAGKLTAASRSRSVVWTPYDTVFSEDTATRPSATDSQMWRTTSLQTLPRKFISAGLWHRPSDSTIDLGSENKGTGITEDSQEADVYSEKSKSLSDLRHMPADEPRLQMYAIGSIDARLNNEKETASQSLSSAAPLRPLPSEEFIRRSLERLNLPDWYLNSSSSLPAKKVIRTSHKSTNGTTKLDATSFSSIDVGQPKEADWQFMAVSHPSSLSHDAMSSVTSSDVPTSLSDCHHSQVPHNSTTSQFATSESLQTALDGCTSIHRTSIHGVTDGVLSSTEIHTNRGVSPEECYNREHRQHKRAMKTDENEKCEKCPHGKRNSTKCSQCRHKVPETKLSPTRHEWTVNGHMWNRSSPESTMTASTVLPSEVFQAPAADKGDSSYDNIFSCTTAKESRENHRTRKTSETTTRRKSRTHNRKNMHGDNSQNEVTVTTDYNVTGSQSLCYQKVTANGGNVDGNEQRRLSFQPLSSEAHEALKLPTARPRSLRLRKVKSKTCSEDAGLSTDVSDQNISKQKTSKSSKNYPDKKVKDSAHRNPIYEMAGSPSSRNRIPAKRDLTSIASTTGDALEMNLPKCVCDIPAKASDQNVVAEEKRNERKVQRRRRRRQEESTCPDALSQASRLTVSGDESVIDSDNLQTQPSNRCDNNRVVNGKLTRMPLERHDGEWIGEGTDKTVGRPRRRADNRGTIAESPSGECFQHKEDWQDRCTVDLNDRTASATHRRPRRRLRNDPSSQVNVEQHRPEIDDPPTEMTTTTPDSEHKQRLQHRPANEQSTNMLPVLDSSHQGDELERTVKLFFEGSSSTLMEEYPETTSSRPVADEFMSSTSRRHRDRPRRRFRSSTVTGSNSFPVDSATPEVINAQSQLEQNGTRFESKSNRSESPPTEQKPPVSAAARRCRRVHKSQRSRSADYKTSTSA